MGEAAAREPDNVTLIESVSASIVCGDIDITEVVKLAGGEESTLPIILTIGGAGGGRRGMITTRTDIINAMTWLDGVLVTTFILSAGNNMLAPGDTGVVRAASGLASTAPLSIGLSALAREASASLTVENLISVLNFFLGRLRKAVQDIRMSLAAPTFSLVDEINYTRTSALFPVIMYQQAQEAARAAVAGMTPSSPPRKRGGEATALPPAPVKQPRPAKGKGRGGGADTAAIGGRGSGGALRQLSQAKAQSSSEQQQQQPQQQQQQRQQPAQPQRAAQHSQTPAPAAQQSSTTPAPDGIIGGPQGRVRAVEALDAQFFASVPRAQRPCPWVGLFGSCTKQTCDRCANGLRVTRAQRQAIADRCEPALRASIEAARP